MLMLPESIRIYLAAEPVDMRNQMDGLAALVRRGGGNPLDGNLYVFLSRRRDRVKILAWTRGGFLLWYKRLERGRFRMPLVDAGQKNMQLDAGQLGMLLDGIDFSKVKRAKVWQPKRAA
jgi:transposase